MFSPVLIFPGIGNSGPQHWQSLWEQANPDFIRVPQRDWDYPDCNEWATSLTESILKTGSKEVVIVAHSLACLVVAYWADKQYVPIKGALLVAVVDPAGSNFPNEARGFLSTPRNKFRFPSIVVGSTNDPYSSFEFTSNLAQDWGSTLVNAGDCGHINANSGLSDWKTGYELLNKLRA